jgi:hypothetical protein
MKGSETGAYLRKLKESAFATLLDDFRDHRLAQANHQGLQNIPLDDAELIIADARTRRC